MDVNRINLGQYKRVVWKRQADKRCLSPFGSFDSLLCSLVSSRGSFDSMLYRLVLMPGSFDSLLYLQPLLRRLRARKTGSARESQTADGLEEDLVEISVEIE